MTISTQLGPSYSSFPHSWTYDIFICYRGADTRNDFTQNLYSHLHQNGIETFLADNFISREVELSLEKLFEVIQESRISIVVFSENFASSLWCLEELSEIIQCIDSKNQIVWPIYYKVDPLDVRNQQGSFGEAFVNHEIRFKDNMEKVLRWRTALTEATNLPGWYFKDGHESKFIHNIIEEISVRVLNRAYLNVAKFPVGIESRVRDMNELLAIGVNDVRMVGLWGTAGIGKTTIAKAVYNSIGHKFEVSYFLENVREKLIARGGPIDVDNGSVRIEMIKEMLRHKRVLLILDGVNKLDDLRNWVGDCEWFGSGSRIIITTRDKNLLTDHKVPLIYEAKELDFDEALELFNCNAFRRNEVPNQDAKLAVSVVPYAQGNPLALVVLGSLLCGKSIDQWEKVVGGYRSVPNSGIHEILKLSYNALEDSVKEVFLDIACFLNGKHKDYVIKMLESCHRDPEYSIAVLIENSLLDLRKDHVWMIDLLEEMGREIVQQGSVMKPESRSRLWFYKDVNHVLLENIGTGKMKEIVVQMPEPTATYFAAKGFSKATSTEWTFLLIGLLLEISSLAVDQKSSPSQPLYALFGMLLAFAALCTCICELVHKRIRKRVDSESAPRVLYSTLPNLYGFVGGVIQCICSTIQYVYLVRYGSDPIKVSLLPTIFLICLVVSRLNWFRIAN